VSRRQDAEGTGSPKKEDRKGVDMSEERHSNEMFRGEDQGGNARYTTTDRKRLESKEEHSLPLTVVSTLILRTAECTGGTAKLDYTSSVTIYDTT
jgi:hypothetical protein